LIFVKARVRARGRLPSMRRPIHRVARRAQRGWIAWAVLGSIALALLALIRALFSFMFVD